jgi:hypothetical protein
LLHLQNDDRNLNDMYVKHQRHICHCLRHSVSVVLSALKAIMFLAPPPIIFLRPSTDQPYAVEGWSTAALNPVDLPISRSAMVTEIEWWKSKLGLLHEYLFVKVCVDGVDCWFAVDRNPGSPEADSSTSLPPSILASSPSLSSPSPSLSSVSLSSSSSSLGTTAADHVFVPKGGDYQTLRRALNDDIHLIARLKIPLCASFHVTQLATFLPIVSSHKDKYHPLESQCYWFCLAIVSMICLKYDDVTVYEGKAYKLRGRYLGVPLMQSIAIDDLAAMEAAWNAANGAVANIQTMQDVS